MTQATSLGTTGVGDRIKAARAEIGLTQKALCEAVGMPLPSLRDYELGKTIPGGDAIEAFIRSGINANWLLTGTGPMLMKDLQVLEAPRPPVDYALLTTVLDAVKRALNDAGLQLASSKEAELVSLLYEHFERSAEVEQATVKRFIKLVA